MVTVGAPSSGRRRTIVESPTSAQRQSASCCAGAASRP